MCVAAIITGASPPLADLQDMEAENPHGAGLAWQVPGENQLTYKKGLTAEEVHAILDALPRPVLLHFRWATHGTRSKALTHPFPLGIRALLDPALEGKAKACLIHNGVWDAYRKHMPDFLDTLKLDLSDTAVAAYVALRNPSILRDVRWATAVGRARGKGRPMSVKTTGVWTTYAGNQYSNLQWVGAGKKAHSRRAMSDFYDNWGSVTSHYEPSRPARESAKVFAEYSQGGTTWRKDANTGSWYKVQPDVYESSLHRRDRLERNGGDVDTLMAQMEREDTLAMTAQQALIDDFYMVPETEVMEVKREARLHEQVQPLWDAVRGRWMDEEDDEVGGWQGGGYSG